MRPGMHMFMTSLVLLQDVRKSGQIVAAIAIAFLLLSALVAFVYLLLSLFNMLRGARKANASSPPKSNVAPGLAIAGLVFG